MRRCLTGIRLLLAAPAFVLLMQLALALHHHHEKSFHDDKDSLHSYSTAFYPDHIKQDVLSCPPASLLKYASFYLREHSPENPITPITFLIVDPSHSRAPPHNVVS